MIGSKMEPTGPIEPTDDTLDAMETLVNAYLQSPAAQRAVWAEAHRRMATEGLLQGPRNYYLPAEPFIRPGQITAAPGTIRAHPGGGYELLPNTDQDLLLRGAMDALTGARTMPIRFSDGVPGPAFGGEGPNSGHNRTLTDEAMETAHRQIAYGYVYAREFLRQHQGVWPAQTEAGRPGGWCGRDNCRTPRCVGSGFGCGEIHWGA